MGKIFFKPLLYSFCVDPIYASRSTPSLAQESILSQSFSKLNMTFTSVLIPIISTQHEVPTTSITVAISKTLSEINVRETSFLPPIISTHDETRQSSRHTVLLPSQASPITMTSTLWKTASFSSHSTLTDFQGRGTEVSVPKTTTGNAYVILILGITGGIILAIVIVALAVVIYFKR